jgi:hypothetical protein
MPRTYLIFGDIGKLDVLNVECSNLPARAASRRKADRGIRPQGQYVEMVVRLKGDCPKRDCLERGRVCMPCNLTGKGRDARDLALRQRLGCERQSGCGFKISLRHFVSNGGGHNEPKFGIHRAGLVSL